MAFFRAQNIVLLIVVFFYAIHVNESRNFPLDGCSTDKMDLLVLRTEAYRGSDGPVLSVPGSMMKEFVKHLLSFPSNESTPRIMFADIYDRFSVSDPLVNVSSWEFLASPQKEAYGFQYIRRVKYRNNILEIVEKKVAFIRRLFLQMSGVRKNVTQVVLLFLDGNPLSYEEIRSVPHLIEQQDTDIKIFTVVVRGEDHTEVIHLSDTLVGTYQKLPARALVMAICNQCVAGSFQFRHTTSADYLSCYKISEFYEKAGHNLGYLNCLLDKNAILVMLETFEEFDFLRDKLVSYFKSRVNHSDNINGSAIIPIGLKRPYAYDRSTLEFDVKKKKLRPTTATRLKWHTLGEKLFRPLVLNKWLPGNPSGGYTHDCAMWQFSWDRSANMDAVNASSSNEGLVDGWVDVGCADEIATFSLCEINLPRRVDVLPPIKIKPANEKSFRRVLNKPDFMKFGENIVSITANIIDPLFRTFLRDTNRDFPVFDCSADRYNLQYVSYLHVCDHIDHCNNRMDESICPLDPSESPSHDDIYSTNCYGVQCCDGACLPLQLVNDGEVDCWICDNLKGNFTDELAGLNKYLNRNETCAFICNNDQCVHFSQLNDGHTDCTGPEGPLDETVGKLKTADTCYNMLGHKIWAPMCVYVKDRFDNLLGCRDLSHLKNCTDFECPEGYVKCLNTYCIPQHYVLDGTLDCPTGEDEQADVIGPCTGNVACWNSKICLHPDLVCDGHPDCPHGDDEADCDDHCAEGFRCVAGTVTVWDYNRSVPLTDDNVGYDSARYVDASGLDLSQKEDILHRFPATALLFKCSSCNIVDLTYFFNYYIGTIQDIDISYNQIQKIDGDEIRSNYLKNVKVLNMSYNRELILVRSLNFPVIEVLDFSHTALASIDQSDIGALRNLKHLDLSFTRITRLDENSLPSKVILQTLELRGLLLEDVHEDFFNGLTVSHDLYTDSYQLCCPQVRGANIPDHTCHAHDDAISSCFDLIGVDVQRVLLWVVAVLAVLGNITVIVYRVIWDRSVLRTGYGRFVTNLGISDFFMGVYLFIIAGADYYYRGVYVLHDESWRESVACTLAGFLATLSSETSMLFIFFISLDRFLVMKFPFGQIKFTQKGKTITLALSWVFGFLLALTPIVFRFDLYSSNAVCLGLPLTTKRVNGWEFSFGVFIALNMSQCLVIAYVQRVIFRAMSENRIAGTESNTSSRRIGDIMVAKQLSLVALSCFLCWFPIGVMGLLSLSGHEIGNDVFAWTMVIVLPVNSAANPILYTIPALMAKWEKFKQGGKRSRRRSV